MQQTQFIKFTCLQKPKEVRLKLRPSSPKAKKVKSEQAGHDDDQPAPERILLDRRRVREQANPCAEREKGDADDDFQDEEELRQPNVSNVQGVGT